MEEIIKITRQIIEPSFRAGVVLVKYIFIAASAFLAGVIIYARYKTRWARIGKMKAASEFFQTTAYEAAQFVKKWETVKKRLEKGWESENKLAVIEADEMLEEVLKRCAYTGKNVEERLSKVPDSVLPNKEELKKAHQLCSDIVHDPDYKLSLDKARWAIDTYEQTFHRLDALD